MNIAPSGLQSLRLCFAFMGVMCFAGVYSTAKRQLASHFRALFGQHEPAPTSRLHPFGFIVQVFLQMFESDARLVSDACLSPRLVARALERLFRFVTVQQSFVQLGYEKLGGARRCLRSGDARGRKTFRHAYRKFQCFKTDREP